MDLLDQNLMWAAVEQRAARTTNPRHKAMLEMIARHSRAEALNDFDMLVSTLGAEPNYHFWSDGKDVGPTGWDEVMAFYRGLIGSGASYLESPKERIVVDDDNVVTEMSVRQILPGAVAKANGYAVTDESAFYLIWFRSVILWPFDAEGKIVGEDAYVSRSLADFRKLDDDEVPEVLRQQATANVGRATYVFQ
jgi:hypothetical protein